MIESTYVYDVELYQAGRPYPTRASPDGSKVTYAVKRTERETAWEQGYRRVWARDYSGEWEVLSRVPSLTLHLRKQGQNEDYGDVLGML